MDAMVSGLGTAPSAIDARGERRAGTFVRGCNGQGALERDGRRRFFPLPDLDLTPARNARVCQRVLEQFNVDPMLTLVEMIDAMRVYEASQRAARGVDETLSQAINDVARA
jgi:flagellar basal body rod protein FlgG